MIKSIPCNEDFLACKSCCATCSKREAIVSFYLNKDRTNKLDIEQALNEVHSPNVIRGLCILKNLGTENFISKTNLKTFIWGRPISDNSLLVSIHQSRNWLAEHSSDVKIINIRQIGYAITRFNKY